MPKASTNSQPKATVVAKVIRADGTEETYVSHDVSITDVEAVTEALAEYRQGGELGISAEEAERRNAEESERNEAANRAAEKSEG